MFGHAWNTRVHRESQLRQHAEPVPCPNGMVVRLVDNEKREPRCTLSTGTGCPCNRSTGTWSKGDDPPRLKLTLPGAKRCHNMENQSYHARVRVDETASISSKWSSQCAFSAPTYIRYQKASLAPGRQYRRFCTLQNKWDIVEKRRHKYTLYSEHSCTGRTLRCKI